MPDLIAVESTLSAPTNQIWTALVDPDVRAHWWPGLTFDAISGGALQEQWSQDGVDHVTHGVVRDVVPNELLRFSWSDDEETPTSVTISLHQTRHWGPRPSH